LAEENGQKHDPRHGKISRKAIFIPQIKPHNQDLDYKISKIIPLYKRKREQGHQCSLLTQRVLGREGTLKEHSDNSSSSSKALTWA
jgi:hypothetical protein